MARQVKPFKSPVALGYMVWCDYEDGETAPELEGVVYFDSPPAVGDTAVLGDGRIWRVKRPPNDEMEVWMAEVPAGPAAK